MKYLLSALAGFAILSATQAFADIAPPPPTPPVPHSCIRQNDIHNWSSIDDKHLILENFRHQKWQAKLVGTCGNFKFRESLIIKSHSGLGISCVEPGDIVITHGMGIPGRCAIVSIEPYTPPAKPHTSANGATEHDTH